MFFVLLWNSMNIVNIAVIVLCSYGHALYYLTIKCVFLKTIFKSLFIMTGNTYKVMPTVIIIKSMLYFSTSLQLILYGNLCKCPKLIFTFCNSFLPGCTWESPGMLNYFFNAQVSSHTKLIKNLSETAPHIGMFRSFLGDPSFSEVENQNK